MNVGVLGSGTVGRTLAAKIASLGHDVLIGTRDVEASLARDAGPMERESFADWHAANPGIGVVPFAEAASHGEILFNATNGAGGLEALASAGEGNLNGKVLIDVSNPLDFSNGMPPSLLVSNTDSLGEQIQRTFPDARVVKTLNTVNVAVGVDPAQLAGGDHHLFVSGDDAAAKATVTGILKDWFGWRNVIDLGDITTARGTEMYLPLWVRLYAALGTPVYNIKVVH